MNHKDDIQTELLEDNPDAGTYRPPRKMRLFAMALSGVPRVELCVKLDDKPHAQFVRLSTDQARALARQLIVLAAKVDRSVRKARKKGGPRQ